MFCYCQVTKDGLGDFWEGTNPYAADDGVEEDIEFDFEEHLSCAKFYGPDKEVVKLEMSMISIVWCMETMMPTMKMRAMIMTWDMEQFMIRWRMEPDYG